MNYIQKVGYLKGLADGLDPDYSTKEGKLLKAIVDLVEDMASEIESVKSSMVSVEEQLDDLYEELDDLGEELEGLGDFDSNKGGDNIRVLRDEDNAEDNDEPVVYQLICPACQGEILMEEDELLGDSITCPNCDAQLELDLGCGCGDCGCGHGHDHEHDEELVNKEED